MANEYTTRLKKRLPAAGDIGWDDEWHDNERIDEVVMSALLTANRVISGGEVVAGVGLVADYAAMEVLVAATSYTIAAGNLALTAAVAGEQANWIYVSSSGVVTANIMPPAGDYVPLARVDTSATAVIRISDLRPMISNIAPNIHAAVVNAVPVDADEIPLADSAATFGLKKVTWAAIKSTLGTTWKDTTGGFVGLTLFKINFKNTANTFTSFLTNANTAARTYTFQNRDGTIADNTDLELKVNLAETSAWNDIINGDFKIAQIGTSFTAPASGAYDLDGWNIIKIGAAVYNVAQVAGSSVGKYARQTTITTIDAVVDAGDIVTEGTRIEGSDIVKYVGNTFTIGFVAKFPVVGIHCVSLRNSGVDRSYVAEVNCLVANAWASYSFTVVGGLPTAGIWNYTNGVGLHINLCHAVGTSYKTTANAWNTGNFLGTANQVNDCATAGNVWAIEAVTISLGKSVIPSNVSYREELARCQRYAPVFNSTSGSGTFSSGQITSTSAANIGYEFVVKPRIPPTGITTTAVANFTLNEPGITTSVVTAITFSSASEKTCSMAVTGTGTPYTVGRGVILLTNISGARIEFTGARL